jgi:hypothetical protein
MRSASLIGRAMPYFSNHQQNRQPQHGFGADFRSLPVGVRTTLAAIPLEAPPSSLAPFHGPDDTVGELRRAVTGERGERSVVVYQATENVVRGLQPKDYLSEIIAIRNFVATRTRYKNDPYTTEWVSDPQRLIEEISKHGRAVGDCDDIAGLMATMVRQLGREARWVTVGFQAGAPHTHIFTIALEPKSHTWIVLDPVAGVQEPQMLSRVKTHRIWRID